MVHIYLNIVDLCTELEISSNGGAMEEHPETIGMYIKEHYINELRLVYRHKERELFLYWISLSTGIWLVRMMSYRFISFIAHFNLIRTIGI